MRVRLLILALAPILAGATLAGVSADGVRIPATTQAVPDWSGCTGVVAYWTMDNATGLQASAGSCASGTDCDLSDPGSAGYVTGVRGNAKAMDYIKELTCGVSASCFPSGDISIVGWAREGSGGLEVSFLAGSGFSNTTLTSNGTAGVNGDSVSTFETVESATEFGFLSLSYDDSADTLIACGSDLGNFAWGCATNSSATAGNPGGGSGFCYPITTSSSACDELAVFDVPLAEAELCRICSCWLDGTACLRSGSTWVHTGNNSSRCGGCALPADASTACLG